MTGLLHAADGNDGGTHVGPGPQPELVDHADEILESLAVHDARHGAMRLAAGVDDRDVGLAGRGPKLLTQHVVEVEPHRHVR